MLPILFLTFLLAQVQVLQADEFPNILSHVILTWGGETLTRKVNARQTMSIDGEVPSLILCGPFQTSGKDGDCRIVYNWKYYPSPGSTSSGTGASPVTAKLLSTINETYSCMSFDNKLPDFVNMYNKSERSGPYNTYSLQYTCQTSTSVQSSGTDTQALLVLAMVALFLLYGGWFIAKQCGERKNQNSVENSEVYEANTSGVVGGNAPAAGPSSKTTYCKTSTGVYYQKEWTF